MTLLMRFWKRNDTIWKLRTSKLVVVRKTLSEPKEEKKQVLELWTWFTKYYTTKLMMTTLLCNKKLSFHLVSYERFNKHDYTAKLRMMAAPFRAFENA